MEGWGGVGRGGKVRTLRATLLELAPRRLRKVVGGAQRPRKLTVVGDTSIRLDVRHLLQRRTGLGLWARPGGG